jgi:hypothetical protein
VTHDHDRLGGIEFPKASGYLAHRDVQCFAHGGDCKLIVLAHVEQHDVVPASVAGPTRGEFGGA